MQSVKVPLSPPPPLMEGQILSMNLNSNSHGVGGGWDLKLPPPLKKKKLFSFLSLFALECLSSNVGESMMLIFPKHFELLKKPSKYPAQQLTVF